MCELCGISKTTVQPLNLKELKAQADYDPDDYVCEWVKEGEVEDPIEIEGCWEPALYLVTDEFIDEHMCAEHAKQEIEFVEDDASAWLSDIGLGETEIIAIQKGGTCDYFDPLDPGECHNKAVYAKRLRVEMLLCKKHAIEEGHL